MNEGFLYFIWQDRLYGDNRVTALTGEELEIVDPGKRNHASGPDFFDARIKINGLLWAGNVEIHVKASDWLQHSHKNDPAYKNVILHVVYEYDCNIADPCGGAIPVLQLSFSKDLLKRYKKLIANPNPIHCSGEVSGTEPFRTKAFLQSMALERLCEKAEGIQNLLKKNNNNLEDTFYSVLARSFGFHINAVPFEMLASMMPLKLIAKHRNSILQTEALLFGQAGLLNDDIEGNGYYKRLQYEFSMFRNKFGLQPMNPVAWKFSPVRPNNFPSIRIAQFAAVLHGTFPLFSQIIEAQTPDDIEKMIRVEPSEYWKTHFSFTSGSEPIVKKMGRSSFHVIVINTLSPFLYLYGQMRSEEKYSQRAVDLLESIPPEQNHIVSLWKKEKLDPDCALETQAMIQLYRNYCAEKRCIECTIGSMIVKGKQS